MAKTLQFRRGNTAQTLANTMAAGELFINSDTNTIAVGDGVTAGGTLLATLTQLSGNVSTINTSISGKLSCTGGGTVCSATLCNSTLTGTLAAGGTCGTSGQLLCSTGSGVAWATVSGGGGSSYAKSCSNSFLSPASCGGSLTGRQNFASGCSALGGVTTGINNFAVGYKSLTCITTGNNNIAIGACAGRYMPTSAALNIAIGYGALMCSNCIGNVALGYNAGKFQTGNLNVAIGSYAGRCTIGQCNTSVGTGAFCCAGAAASIALGINAARTGCFVNSIFVGVQAGINRTSSRQCSNIGIGYGALYTGYCSSGNCYNTALGHRALAYVSSASFNIAIGKCSGCGICAGNNNIILGTTGYIGSCNLANTVVLQAGNNCLKLTGAGCLTVNGSAVGGGGGGVSCIAAGSGVTISTTASPCCVTICASGGGGSAAYCKSFCNSVFAPASCNSSLGSFCGHDNIMIGRCAGYNNCSNFNISIGYQANKSTTGASRVIAIGTQALAFANPPQESIAIGSYAGASSAGCFNVIIGKGALACGGQSCSTTKSVIIGAYAAHCGLPGFNGCLSQSVIIGYKTGLFCGFCSAVSCNFGNVFVGTYSGCGSAHTYANVILGSCSGMGICGNKNTIVGSCVANGGSAPTGSNNTLIGYGATPLSGICSNTITLGNSSITSIRAQQTSITSLSDYRDKAYIETLPVGLEFLRQVRPVTFTWKPRDTSNSLAGRKEAGFIAQELETVANNSSIKDWLDGLVISNDDRSRLEATPGKMFPLIVKAIQELATENDSLKARVTALEAAINK